MIAAKILKDSIAPNNCRLTTMEWTYPRFIHSEIMTHRKLSRNSASSRAIPLAKMIERVINDPVIPIHWGKNQKGMQASEELGDEQKRLALFYWLTARDSAIVAAKEMERIGLHKQLANRLLEPWMWITIIVSATNFENLFALRCHKDAEPHFQDLAYKARAAYDQSTPDAVDWGEWHLPLVDDIPNGPKISVDDIPYYAKVSAGRCARVSYLTHEGKRDLKEDVKLYERLAGHYPMHASPLEHPAMACHYNELNDWGNYDPGWLQLRKMVAGENITKRV